MKKIILTLLVIAICSSLFAKLVSYGKPSAPTEQILLGYVDASVYMVVNIIEDVLPFDIDSPTVQSRETGSPDGPDAVRGLRIGYYSLISNSFKLSVTVEHDKLKRFSGAGTVPEGKDTEIDYRLYFFTKGQDFESCLAGEEIKMDATTFSYTNGILAQSNRSIYLSLAEDPAKLAAGDYESYITISVGVTQ